MKVLRQEIIDILKSEIDKAYNTNFKNFLSNEMKILLQIKNRLLN